MNIEAQIAELVDVVKRLRKADPTFRVFGASTHRYVYKPTLSEKELQLFEAKHELKLPADYRLYLKEVSDGGVGPYYGLETLDRASNYRNLRQSFPFTASDVTFTDPAIEEHGAFDDISGFVGMLQINHQGCAAYSDLVVRGPAHGSLWYEWNGEAIRLEAASFAQWYKEKMKRSLTQLENEPLGDKISLGMTTQEVVALTGEGWKEKMGEYGIFFTSPDFAPILELDGNQTVIKITRHKNIYH